MRPKKATPEEGVRIDREHFVNFSPKPGTAGTVSGWCACEPWCGFCHDYHEDHGPTKVCLHWFTDGALYCERCRRQPAVEKMWYCLWWRDEDGAPLLTICRNAAADFVKDLKYGDSVYCGKVDKLSSNFLKRSGGNQKFASSHPLRQKEVEILPTLLMVWKFPQLDKWCQEQDRAERYQNAKPAATEKHTLSVPPPTSEIEALAIDAHRRLGHLQTIGELSEEVERRAKRQKAEKNGKHEAGEGN